MLREPFFPWPITLAGLFAAQWVALATIPGYRKVVDAMPWLAIAGPVVLAMWMHRRQLRDLMPSPTSSPSSPSSPPSSTGESPFGRDADGMPQVMA